MAGLIDTVPTTKVTVPSFLAGRHCSQLDLA